MTKAELISMTKAELIMALRRCSYTTVAGADREDGYCKPCAYFEDASDITCIDRMMIDAADALEAAYKRIAIVEEERDLERFAAKNYLDKIDEFKAQLPKEGEWIYEDLDNFRKYKVTCPHCDAWYIGNYDAYDEPSDFNYCPHCGNICNPANLAWEKELSERERKEQTDETD